MGTSSLFVEILTIGAIADIWLFLILRVILLPSGTSISEIALFLYNYTKLLAIPFLSLTYVLGWTINFLADNIFRWLFQGNARDGTMKEARLENKKYLYIRSYFSQKASAKLVQDWDYTRHCIRVARSSALNFIALAITLSLNIYRHHPGILITIGLCVTIAIVAWWQATTLSGSNYRRLIVVYNMLREETVKPRKNGHQKKSGKH
jgi:hypothetical protein